MKRILLLSATLLLVVASLKAQVELKAFVGTNFSSFTNPPANVEYAAKAGYQFGAGLLIGEKFYVEPGIQFVRNSNTITEETTEFTFTQNFVKIPVYAGYHILGSESSLLALRVFAGPAVSIAGKIAKGEDQISKDDVKNLHWLVEGGLGLDVLFLFAEVNYEYAFSKYFDNGGNDSNMKGVVINAGVHFDF